MICAAYCGLKPCFYGVFRISRVQPDFEGCHTPKRLLDLLNTYSQEIHNRTNGYRNLQAKFRNGHGSKSGGQGNYPAML